MYHLLLLNPCISLCIIAEVIKHMNHEFSSVSRIFEYFLDIWIFFKKFVLHKQLGRRPIRLIIMGV